MSRFALSHYEHGRRTPTLRTLEAVLAAAGLQVRAELEPLDADVRAAIVAAAEQPIDDRDGVYYWGQIHRIEEVDHRVEGLAAASVLGAPVPVDVFEMALADVEATFQWLSDELMSWIARVRAPEWSIFDTIRGSARHVREVLATECPDGWFWLRSGFTDARVRLASPDEVDEHVRVHSRHGAIPVQPMHEIEATDRKVARVLRVLREVPPSEDDQSRPASAAPRRPVPGRFAGR